MDVGTLYRRTLEMWADRVADAAGCDWTAPTPCREWTVRDLVNHVTGEDLWTAPLLRGETIERVGHRFDGDLLGSEPVSRALYAAGQASALVAEMLPRHGTVHLSYGEESVEEYVHQLAADHLVHAWDLAAATGGDTHLDPKLVAEVTSWFAGREDGYRSAGAVGPRIGMSGDPQHDLLAAFGRDAHWGPNHAGLARFSAAFSRGDIEAIMAHMTDDCVFEATGPAPDGIRHEGAEAVRQVWEEVFTTTRDPSFTEEDLFVAGERGVLRWRFSWANEDGSPGHVRGVDVLRLRDGKVCEKLSYVKG